MGRSHHTSQALDARTPCAEAAGSYTPHCTAAAAAAVDNYNTYPTPLVPSAFLVLMAVAYDSEVDIASTYPSEAPG